jgi:hypothetical protein
LGIGLLVVVVIAVVVASLVLFVIPPSRATSRQVDAVAMLSGGRGDRLPKALAGVSGLSKSADLS